MILQILVNGILSGLTYVVMALGFTLIFGIMRIVNFAHGEFYMIGAMALMVLFDRVGLPFLASVVLAGVFTGALGLACERLFFRRLVGEELPGMITALAVSITLQAVVLLIFGPAEQTVTRPFAGTWTIFGAVVPWDRTVVAIGAFIILVAFHLFMNMSRLGLAMRAVAIDPETASLMGVESGLIYAASFGLASVLAGLAGALMAPIYTIGPAMGGLPMLKAFVVVILGGLGSIPGAVLGGLLLGLSESALATTLDSTVALIWSFVVVLCIIIVRPTGLLGRRL
jgi:branched-chain amino acid transport system permease protein